MNNNNSKLTPEMEKLLESVAQNEGIHNYKISDIQFNKKGEGYLGEVCFLSILDQTTDKKLHVVVKAAFKDEKIREHVPIRMVFENEISFYKVIYPAFEEFAHQRGLLNLPQITPKCLAASADFGAEYLVLENLKPEGFQVRNKRDFFDEEHLEVIFRTYGTFHAYSLALRDQNRDKFDSLCELIPPVLEKFLEGVFPTALQMVCEIVSTAVRSDIDPEVMKNFEKYLDNPAKLFESCLKSDPKYDVITHGDCWSNNLLFKYKNPDAPKEIEEIRLIDFQLLRKGSPVCDLSYSFYSGVTKTHLDKLDHYLGIYHKSLSKTLKDLGSDPEELFPFAALKEQWKAHAKFGLLWSFMLLKIKLTDEENIVDLTDVNLEDPEEENKAYVNAVYDRETFKIMVMDLLVHANEIGAL